MGTEGRGVVTVDFDATRHGVEMCRAVCGWYAATGMQCESALCRYNTDMTALAVEDSKATSGCSGRLGRRESTDWKSRSLKDKLKERRARNLSL
jgi:hypothetical protein